MDDIKQPRRWAAWMAQLFNTLPCTCTLCKYPSRALLCARCSQSLHWTRRSCIQCGESLAGVWPYTQPSPLKRCGRCLSTPSSIEQTLFAYDYDGVMVQLIQQFKFNEALILSQLLGDMIVNRLKESDIHSPDALVPVPLHPGRLKQRGFNQSLELARHIGKTLGIPVYKNLLVRTRATPKQSGLDRKARETNIRGAFNIQISKKMAPLAGKHIAIIDDVITTGSTTREVAKVLKQADAVRISVFAVAKTQANERA